MQRNPCVLYVWYKHCTLVHTCNYNIYDPLQPIVYSTSVHDGVDTLVCTRTTNHVWATLSR